MGSFGERFRGSAAEIAKRVWQYARAFLSRVLLGSLTGVLGGGVGVLFLYALSFVSTAFASVAWLLYLLPVGGLAIVGLYRLLRLPDGIGTDEVLRASRGEGTLPARLAPAIFLSTALTHLLGGSAGREGAALQLGGSVGSLIARALRLPEQDRRVALLCGMSAVFSALFGTPLTAAFFALEVAFVGKLRYAALLPSVFSALVASAFAKLCGFSGARYPLLAPSGSQAIALGQTVLLAAATALLAILFCLLLHHVAQIYRKRVPNAFLRVALGGALVVALSLLEGTRDYNGAGAAQIAEALSGNAVPYAFACKALLTALTLGAGFKGGEIVPSFFIGATFGCVVAPLIGMDPAFGAALGLVAMFCGVTNCPIASTLLALELFGGVSVPLFAVAALVSFVLSGNSGLYHAQRFAFSRLDGAPLDPPAA